MRRHDRDELDDLIDRALPGYSTSEPMHGLEERVLRRVRTAGASSPGPRRYRWALAFPVLAAVFLGAIVLRTLPSSKSQTTGTAAGHALPVTAFKTPPPAPLRPSVPEPASPATKVSRRTLPRQDRRARPAAVPKKESFPTPAPMTAEERALIAWAGREPAAVIQAFEDLRKPGNEPLSIQPIQIQPLHGAW
jgi:hypothetical protein